MNECGKPAVHVGTLKLSTASMGWFPGRTHHGPFCLGCTETPNGWHRQFVADRSAQPGESCTVVPDMPSI